MSLSWEGQEPFVPRKSGEVYGKDLKLNKESTDIDEEFARRINDASSWNPPQQTVVAEPVLPKEKKRCWLLRPVAWLVLLVSVYLMNAVINMFFLTGTYVVDWLSTLPTLAVILLTLAFGSIAISLVFYGAFSLVGLVVTASHAIYPSKIGLRFYMVSVFQLVICVLTVVSAIIDGGSVLFDCLSSACFAIVYIIMLCSTKTLINS